MNGRLQSPKGHLGSLLLAAAGPSHRAVLLLLLLLGLVRLVHVVRVQGKHQCVVT